MTVADDLMEKILQDKERTEEFMRLYQKEEIDSMNYILGKSDDNKVFTKFKLEALSKINLFNRKTVEICKKIWEREMKEGGKNNFEYRRNNDRSRIRKVVTQTRGGEI